MTQTILAYGLIASYFVIERSLRKGSAALDLKPKASDAGSSQVLWVSGTVGLLLAIAAPILNQYSIGHWQNTSAAWFGLMLMVAGLSLRYWAAKTLGEFYTRTLQTSARQTIVDTGPYKIVRHPGYLGTLLLNVGAGLALMNLIVFSIGLTIGTLSRFYRIQAEERMLAAAFSEQFEQYASKTWRLIPYIY